MSFQQDFRQKAAGDERETLIVAARARNGWLPRLRKDVAELEREILRRSDERVRFLCKALTEGGRQLGSPQFSRAVRTIETSYREDGAKNAFELALQVEAQLESAMLAIDRKMSQFSRAAAAYRVESKAAQGCRGAELLDARDLHRLAGRFGGNLSVAYEFVRTTWVAQSRASVAAVLGALRRRADAEVAEGCEEMRRAANTVGARGIAACTSFVERYARLGSYSDALESLHEAHRQVEALSTWLEARASQAGSRRAATGFASVGKA